MPHAKQAEPQHCRGAGSRGGWEALGEVHCGGGRAELKRGDVAGGVAGTAVAARMGGCVNRRHARSNCRA